MKLILLTGATGLREGPLQSSLKITGRNSTARDPTWKPVLAEQETIRDHFRQLVVDLQETGPPERRLQWTFRAYTEGVAFRCALPAKPCG